MCLWRHSDEVCPPSAVAKMDRSIRSGPRVNGRRWTYVCVGVWVCVRRARWCSVLIWAVLSRESSGSAIHMDVTTCPGGLWKWYSLDSTTKQKKINKSGMWNSWNNESNPWSLTALLSDWTVPLPTSWFQTQPHTFRGPVESEPRWIRAVWAVKGQTQYLALGHTVLLYLKNYTCTTSVHVA